MPNESTRPPVRVRFRINIDTGDIEFIIDDLSPDRSEEYHDKVAHAIASFLSLHPEIQDAGAIRYRIGQEWQTHPEPHGQHENRSPGDELAD